MHHIDVRLLQAAVMVVDELNFSRAAIRLHLTQPGLTKQIQDLEIASESYCLRETIKR